jgi:hypothetical protein
MKTSEAKFLLRALRPDGRDAGDPLFAEALTQVHSDPTLRDWLAREQAADATVAAGLAALAPPPSLRDAILVGARASTARPRRAWWQQPLWLAAAACLALAATLAVLRHPGRVAAPAETAFADAAFRDVQNNESAHLGHAPGLAALDARLASTAASVPAALAGLDLAQLRAGGCRTLAVAGHEVFEFCFERDGKWFHLYVAHRTDFLPGSGIEPKPAMSVEEGHGPMEKRLAVASWSDSANLYALVTAAGPAALRQVL